MQPSSTTTCNSSSRWRPWSAAKAPFWSRTFKWSIRGVRVSPILDLQKIPIRFLRRFPLSMPISPCTKNIIHNNNNKSCRRASQINMTLIKVAKISSEQILIPQQAPWICAATSLTILVMCQKKVASWVTMVALTRLIIATMQLSNNLLLSSHSLTTGIRATEWSWEVQITLARFLYPIRKAELVSDKLETTIQKLWATINLPLKASRAKYHLVTRRTEMQSSKLKWCPISLRIRSWRSVQAAVLREAPPDKAISALWLLRKTLTLIWMVEWPLFNSSSTPSTCRWAKSKVRTLKIWRPCTTSSLSLKQSSRLPKDKLLWLQGSRCNCKRLPNRTCRLLHQ